MSPRAARRLTLAALAAGAGATELVTLHYTPALTVPASRHGEYVGFTACPREADPALPELLDVREPRRATIRNARKEGFSLVRDGFELRRWPSAVADFYADPSTVLRTYAPEMEALVAEALGEARDNVRAVVLWDLCLRNSELTHELQQADMGDGDDAAPPLDLLAPVPLVHADFFSPRDVRRRLHDRCTRPTDTLSSCFSMDLGAHGLDAADVRAHARGGGRVASVNVWRSVDRAAPIKRSPLALCHPRSIGAAERVPFAIHCPDVELVEAHVSPDRAAQHEWFSYPEMRHDECLLFVSGDTAEQWPAVPHTAYTSPSATAHDPPRRSIEARLFVLFK